MSTNGNKVFDLAIVGAGPCGLATAIAAGQADLSAVVFDRGCVVNAIVGYPLQMTFFSSPEKLELGGLPFVCRGEKPTRHEAMKYYRKVTQYFGLDVRQYEEVHDIAGEKGRFVLRTRTRDDREHEYSARNVVLATGYFDTPNPLGVAGDDRPRVLYYYREAHPYFDQDCLVIGGGNSAAEAALDLYRASARVMLVHFEEGLDPGVKPWVRPDLENRIEEGAIEARFNHRVAQIGSNFVTLRNLGDDSVERIKNDWVFAMIGYKPDTGFLENAGVRVDDKSGVPEHDPETLETNVPGLFIAGVIVAGFDANKIFIENGRLHGERIVRALRAGEG